MLATRLSVVSCVAPLAKVTTKVAVYISPARNGAVPVIDVELLIVEPGIIDPMNGPPSKVGTLLNETMLTLVMATVPESCTVTVSVDASPSLGIKLHHRAFMGIFIKRRA